MSVIMSMSMIATTNFIPWLGDQLRWASLPMIVFFPSGLETGNWQLELSSVPLSKPSFVFYSRSNVVKYTGPSGKYVPALDPRRTSHYPRKVILIRHVSSTPRCSSISSTSSMLDSANDVCYICHVRHTMARESGETNEWSPVEKWYASLMGDEG